MLPSSPKTEALPQRRSAPFPSSIHRLKELLSELYSSYKPRAVRFRYGLLLFDILTILYFVLSSFLHYTDALHALEVALGVLILLEYAARLWISRRKLHDIFHPVGLADLIVITSLFAPMITENFAFLRVVRALRLLRSYQVLVELRSNFPFVRRHEELLFSILHLVVFIFVMTALVYVLQVDKNPGITNYVDALYFTITALTTTGFGDITLVGTGGKLLAVLIMFFGISLFLRLAQTIFRPSKIYYECPVCGLNRHENDAVHCKHCGTVLHITTAGED